MSWVPEDIINQSHLSSFGLHISRLLCEMETNLFHLNYCQLGFCYLELHSNFIVTIFHWETMSSGFLSPLVKQADLLAWTAVTFGPSCEV